MNRFKINPLSVIFFLIIGQISKADATNSEALPNSEIQSQMQFNQIIDAVGSEFEQDVALLGKQLVIKKEFNNVSSNNAFAKQFPYPGVPENVFLIEIFGGISALSSAGLAFIVCHELGHHLGGFPKNSRFFSKWSSTEGQADYWAAHTCLHRFYLEKSKDSKVEIGGLPKRLVLSCDSFEIDSDRNLCLFKAKASYEAALYLLHQKGDQDLNPFLRSANKIKSSDYMSTKEGVYCRFDTMLAGATCPLAYDENTKDQICTDGPSKRPECWFR